MTLCLAWIRMTETGNQLVLATDSLITGGFRYPYATKLSIFNRRDCAFCWEGSANLAYLFVENARIDVDFSDRLSTHKAALFAVARRVTKVFNQLWQANLNDRHSVFHHDRLSFLLGGYCPRYRQIQIWHIHQDDQLKSFVQTRLYLAANQIYFIGSGREIAGQILRQNPNISPHQLLLEVIEDMSVDHVGGVPQIVTIDECGANVVGVIKEDERYLFGRRLDSSGHRAIQYMPL